MKKMYPPYCVHFYAEHWYDFPVCSPNFNTLREAMDYAATHYLSYKLYRFGCWDSPDPKKAYFHLVELPAQRSLF